MGPGRYDDTLDEGNLKDRFNSQAGVAYGLYGASLELGINVNYRVNCEFEKSAQMSHLCRFHPFSVQTCWGGCLPPLSPPTTERASRSLLWIPLCGTAFD